MATKNLVPRATGEGNLGVPDKQWGGVNAVQVTANKLVSPTIDAINKVLDDKASSTSINTLTTTINNKADKSTVEALTTKVNNKADNSTVSTLANKISGLSSSPFELDANGDIMPRV